MEIHGHRGSRGTHPENTLPSFQEAVRAGVDYIELDVHRLGDGQVVVFHDYSLSKRLCRDKEGRVLNRTLPLRRLTLERIGGYCVGAVPQKSFPGQERIPGTPIPTLDEVLEWMSQKVPLGVKVNVEVKCRLRPKDFAKRVVALLRKHGMVRRAQVQSFNQEVVREAKRLAPGLRTGSLFRRSADFARIARMNGADMVGVRFDVLTERRVQSCHDAGLLVVPWTVNQPEDWDRMLDWGVDGIITDYPRRFAEYLKQRK